MNTERWARVVTLHQWQSTSLGLKVVVQTVTQCCSTLGIVKFAMVKVGESRTRLKLSPHWPEFVLPVTYSHPAFLLLCISHPKRKSYQPSASGSLYAILAR